MRSINAAPALYAQDSFTFVAQRAALLRGYFPDNDPDLATVGNLTAQADDVYKISDLFDITEPESGVALASVGTDGIDGPTNAAGAIADATTIARAQALGLDASAALARHDSHPFFRALGDLVVTGPTGTNVGDLQVFLAT